MEPISFGALHIYASALPHCPLETKLWAKYGGQAKKWILHGERQRNWSANIWASSVQSTVSETRFLQDGRVLACVLVDGTVQLLDAQTGALVGDLRIGHTGSIRSVVFSPDGKVLASASEDKTVRLWDARTAAQLGDPLTGHTGWITSVVFSPDGKVLASVSSDNTV